MPPRPRPRPANRQANEHVQHAVSSLTPAVSLSKTDRESELDRGDELFMRNRNRTAKDWRRLDELAKEQANRPADGDSDAEVSSDDSGTPKKRRKVRQRDDNDLPEWTKQADVTLLTSDDESDPELVDSTSKEADKSTSDGTKNKKTNTRQRSRSRSLTPPPELSMQQILNVRKVVSNALAHPPRADSPTNEYIDDSIDTIVLDEDLASIAREVKAQVNRGGDFESGGGPEIVTIKVLWQPHPLNADGRVDVWTFEMKRHDTFHALFEEVADSASIFPKSLVLTQSGSRVFASATPHSLGIWAEVQLDASDLTTFEYLREHRHEHPPPLADGPSQSSSPSGTAEEDESDAQSMVEDDDDDDVFKLVVRSGVTKDVTLKVRPTTTCGAIVKAFLRRAGIADKYSYSEGKSSRGKNAVSSPRLVIDGEHMNPDIPISEADLEDGDQVEVTGL